MICSAAPAGQCLQQERIVWLLLVAVTQYVWQLKQNSRQAMASGGCYARPVMILNFEICAPDNDTTTKSLGVVMMLQPASHVGSNISSEACPFTCFTPGPTLLQPSLKLSS